MNEIKYSNIKPCNRYAVLLVSQKTNLFNGSHCSAVDVSDDGIVVVGIQHHDDYCSISWTWRRPLIGGSQEQWVAVDKTHTQSQWDTVKMCALVQHTVVLFPCPVS